MGALEDSKVGGRFLLVALLGLVAGCGDNTPAFRATEPQDGPGQADAPLDAPAADSQGDAADAAGDARNAPDAGDATSPRDLADATDTPLTDATDASDGGNVADVPGATDAADATDTVDSGRTSSCVITNPILSATHPALNGVPVAQGGDRASAPGAPYAVTFEVSTNLVDGESVELDLESQASGDAAPGVVTTLTAKTAGGEAIFTNVALPSDATYEVQARCIDENGITSPSARRLFPVDTTPPNLVVSKPHAGDAIPPSGLTNDAFPVCGSTTSQDAVGLDAALGARVANYCVGVGGAPSCVAATMTGTDVCVQVPCPGDAPFDLTATLTDGAGNTTTQTLAAVSCFSMLPSVRIVAPVSDAPAFADKSKRLLAADTTQTLHDLQDAVAGAQTNVVACANRAGTMSLFAGIVSDATLGPLASNVPTRAAVPADGCPAGFGFVSVFTNATLPESAEATDTSLVTATRLRADLTDLSGTRNGSPFVDLWVDSVDPVLLLTVPPDICGSVHHSNDVYLSSETVTSTAPNVTLDLRNDMSNQTFDSTTFTTLTFPFVVFAQGETFLSGVARDDAGNASSLTPDPCTVIVEP
jgi:hypothetical protein